MQGQSSIKSISCSACKDGQLIEKYLELVKLLNKKIHKKQTALSKISQEADSFGVSKISLASMPSEFKEIIQDCKRTKNNSEQFAICRLALIVLDNRSKKALLKCGFDQLKIFCSQPKQQKSSQEQAKLQSRENLGQFIQETLDTAKTIRQGIKSSEKQLHSKIFSLQLQNKLQKQEIEQLKKKLIQVEKRFEKETEKKRQSLETVAQEIREKSEYITQLQILLKKYEIALKTSGDKSGSNALKMNTDNVLIEDIEEIKERCTRLESINEKLNEQLQQSKSAFSGLKEENEQLKRRIKQLESQSLTLKQENFEGERASQEQLQMRNYFQLLSQRLSKKLEYLRAYERQNLKSSRRCREPTETNHLFLSGKLSSELETEESLGSGNSSSTKESNVSIKDHLASSHQQMNFEHKVESILMFLFHIQDHDYQLQYLELFDQEEIELLKSHQQNYLKHSSVKRTIDETIDAIERIGVLKTQKLVRDQNQQIGEDEIESPVSLKNVAADNSFFNALDQNSVMEPASNGLQQQKGHPALTKRMIGLEIENNRLVEKISELKNLQMHVRNVVLNLLKAFDQNRYKYHKLSSCNTKPEFNSILEVVFDFFEYSEEEKSKIVFCSATASGSLGNMTPKRRFFGII